MLKKNLFAILAVMSISLLLSGFLSGCKMDKIPPKVIGTSPPNGATNVDPSLTEISVTFNEPMKDKSWSWCYEEKKHFPETIGEAYYSDNNTRCALPVKLEPFTEYIIWINLDKFNNFRDKSGNPVKPYKFTFMTSENASKN